MRLSNVSRAVQKPTINDIKVFSGGYSSIVDEARMPSKFAVQAINMIQDQDGIWSTRWGMDYYGEPLEVEQPVVFSNGYSHRRIITLDPSKIASLTNFVIYLDVEYSYLATVANGGLVTSGSGYDIRFETLEGIKLNHEVVTWSATTGELKAYIQIPSLSINANTIYIYYGNSGVVSAEANPTQVFNTNLKAQYRFADGALTTDSTANANTLTPIGVPVQATPRWGTGCVGLGTSQAFSAVDGADFRPAGNFSIAGWIRTNKTGATQFIFQSYANVTNLAGLQIRIHTDNKIRFYTAKNTGTSTGTDYTFHASTNTVTDGAWHLIVATYDGAKIHVYIDGAEEGTGTAWTAAAAFQATSYVRVGCGNDTGSNGNYMQGTLDEVSFFPSDALSLAQVQSLYAASITDASNSAIKALASAVYLFNDGGQLVDSSTGGTHTLTAIGTPTTCTTKFGGSVFLGNSSAYSAVDATVLKPTGNFTVGGWIKTAGTGLIQDIFHSYSANTYNAGIKMYVHTDNKIRFITGKNTGTTAYVDYTLTASTSTVNDNLWHFVVITWDGSYIRYYKDGISDMTPSAWANAPVYAATNYVRVGNGNNVGTERDFFFGQLDDIFLLNGTALSADEILTEYNNSLPNFMSTADEEIGFYDIDGAYEYIRSDLTREVIAIAGGRIFKSTDKNAWTQIGSDTLTPGKAPDWLQINNQLYITNGYDNLRRYDGTSILVYTGLTPASDLSFARTVLTTGSFHYYYMVTALNDVGETVGSNEIDATVNKVRESWGSTEFLTLSWSKVTGATRYRVYAYDQSGFESYLDDVVGTADATQTYKEIGTTLWNGYVPVPDSDTSSAPKFTTLEMSDNRLWGTGDPDNPWRVYWASADANTWGSWSSFDGGGYVDLELGGREIPVRVVHYRTGSGVSVATVLCSSPEGTGSIWQITLEVQTFASVSFVQPVVQKITGSIGSNSPFSITKARDNIGFCNSKGFFLLKSKPQMLNLLSTDETSQPIRPDYRSLNQSLIPKLCSYYFEGKIFFSGAEGGSNDVIFIYDMEYNNWNYKWTQGVSRFFEHTENAGGDSTTHLLCVPTTGNRLWEINQNFEGDFGQPFYQSYLSPLLPVSEDKTNVLKTKESIVELGRPKGTITYEILGTEATRGFSSLSSRTITSDTSGSGISTDLFSDFLFSDTSGFPTTFSTSSLKKAIKIKKRLYNIQHHIYSSSANTKYSILSIQAKGRLLAKKTPSQWFS